MGWTLSQVAAISIIVLLTLGTFLLWLSSLAKMKKGRGEWRAHRYSGDWGEW